MGRELGILLLEVKDKKRDSIALSRFNVELFYVDMRSYMALTALEMDAVPPMYKVTNEPDSKITPTKPILISEMLQPRPVATYSDAPSW